MPGLGTSTYLPEGGWQTSFSMRYQFSDRHFRGDEEQKERKEMGTQVENTIFLFDLGLTYGLSERTSVSLSLPFLIARRTGPNRDFPGERYDDNARGIGDLIVTARRWMLDPDENPDQNVQLGLGIKLPTGQTNAMDARKTLNDDDEVELEIRNVDQSIQPGDGGFGFLVDVNAFKQIGSFSPYVAGTYLFNPQNKNGVRTFRSRSAEAIMSIPDAYVARAGTLWTPVDESPFSLGLGGRIEGIPAYDLIGPQDGFRRPGYAVSVEPSLVWSYGKSIFSVSAPVAVYRNRVRSVPDKETGRHGDAAFADWLLLFGWTYSF